MVDYDSFNPDGTLKHFGVKGMKWGVRKKRDDSGGPSNRELNKASRNKDFADAKQKTLEARKRAYGGSNKEMLRKAEAQYKTDKAKIGSREAGKILAATRQKALDDIYQAQAYTSGKEAAKDLVLTAVLGTGGAAVAREVGFRRAAKKSG